MFWTDFVCTYECLLQKLSRNNITNWFQVFNPMWYTTDLLVIPLQFQQNLIRC